MQPKAPPAFDELCKIVLVGPHSSGRHTLLHQYIYEEFSDFRSNTGLDFSTKIEVFDQYKVKLQIWPRERGGCHSGIASHLIPFYRNAGVVLFLFDLTNKTTFEGLRTDHYHSLDEVDRFLKSPHIKVLVGNKCDLTTDRQISREEAEEFARANDIPLYVESSAKDHDGTSSLFRQVTLAGLNHVRYRQHFAESLVSRLLAALGAPEAAQAPSSKSSKSSCLLQ